MKIKEVIVVEGRDDEQVVKQAVKADVIRTNGYSYGHKLKEKLKKISLDRGIIILTDPDYVGKKIRKDLSDYIPGAKHAFVPRGKSIKKDDVGIENASPQDVKKAIEEAKPTFVDFKEEFTKSDMIKYGLNGRPNSSNLRQELANRLGIGYGNSKFFLDQLNNFQIDRKDLERVLEEINK